MTDTPKPRVPGPDEVPYLNQSLTFRGRETELTMYLQMLERERSRVLEELQYVRRCIATRDYPGIVLEPEV